MSDATLDATYFSEALAVENNAVNRYLMRAFSVPAGDERDLVLDLALQHLRKVEVLIKKARNVATEVVVTPKPKLDQLKVPKAGKAKAALLPDLE